MLSVGCTVIAAIHSCFLLEPAGLTIGKARLEDKVILVQKPSRAIT